jgi:hypothetical protein
LVVVCFGSGRIEYSDTFPGFSMISRQRVIRTLNHQPIDRAPRDLWLMPGTESARGDDVAEMEVRFPSDFLHLETSPPPGKKSKPHAEKSGTFTDAWGCAWKVDSPNPGAPGLLAASPLAGAASLTVFHPPAELLEAARFAKINAACDATARFTLGECELHPLERLGQLRGPETALRELAEGNLELRNLLARLHDFYRREVEHWAKTHIDGVVLCDDLSWAAQSRVCLDLWRAIVKPLFRDACAIAHGHDKFVFFRARGAAGDTMDDLIEIGVDAVHAEWPLDEFVKLAAKRRGRIVFWGGVENQRLQAPAQPAEVRDAVFRVRKAADFGAGGIISQVAWTKDLPLRNIVTYFEQWLTPLPVAV